MVGKKKRKEVPVNYVGNSESCLVTALELWTVIGQSFTTII